ncbi:unnamed protein product [Vitrella brassicaformis CCMP3155]|uniref:UBX domain-containing protein n=2 Tax=Vitrella brassicaformis TaxID=1169539 RepID=A0A0G4F8E7_VITBC|nr:unnamed protein product [Vitrella brassicaformis CCMP3155]|mmetsp:Transcript_1256/g.3244  ORF Transcript_1256/g.3244 Transcript_1256/m.3244 type:complete len:480 (+) Transcript_1256:164-1603(+)|eukprot:CEM08817.1 unnamed protein product [Vitrella brassicaformis CCMP3155]
MPSLSWHLLCIWTAVVAAVTVIRADHASRGSYALRNGDARAAALFRPRWHQRREREISAVPPLTEEDPECSCEGAGPSLDSVVCLSGGNRQLPGILSVWLLPFAWIRNLLDRIIYRDYYSGQAASRVFLHQLDHDLKSPAHPRPLFFKGSFKGALDHARQTSRFLLVYIRPAAVAAKRRGGRRPTNVEQDVHFLTRSLTSSEVCHFLGEHFVCWGAISSQQQAGRALRELKVRSKRFPTLIIVHSPATPASPLNPPGPPSMRPSVLTTHACRPPPSSAQFLSWLNTTANVYGARLDKDRAAMAAFRRQRALAKEQREAYREALKRDRMAGHEREGASEGAGEPLEDGKGTFDLADEPEATARDVVTLSVRLPDGRRLRRRYRLTAKWEDVYQWIANNYLPEDAANAPPPPQANGTSLPQPPPPTPRELVRQLQLSVAFPPEARIRLSWASDRGKQLRRSGLGRGKSDERRTAILHAKIA